MELQLMRNARLSVLAIGIVVCSVGLSLGLSACATAPSEGSTTLYARLGGQATVTRVATRTIERAAHDPRTQRSFDGIKLAAIEASLAQQICSISGGGCKYEGETMARAHHDAKIRAGEFDALVDILREELDAAGVDAGAKNELLKLLAPMKRDIVTG
jgi:hemoglobin